MKWRTFFQIILLIIFAAVVFYIAFPKFYFYPTAPTLRANKITGKIELYENYEWRDLTKKEKKTDPLLEKYGIE
ncbi:hypothetical protein ES703_28151 [subsurface metagenome]